MFERALGETDQQHAIVDAARPEPALGDFVATATTEKNARRRHPDAAEDHLGMAARPLVIAEGRQHAFDYDSRMRQRQRQQDHRLPAVAVRVARRLFGATSSHFSDLQMSDRLRPTAVITGPSVTAASRLPD